MRYDLTVTSVLFLLTACSGQHQTAAANDADRIASVDVDRLELPLSDDVSLELVQIKPGRFVMGSRLAPDRLKELFGDVAGDPNANAVDAVRREVTIPNSFWLGAHEVTNRQFAAFVEATGYVTEGERAGFGFIRRGGKWTYAEDVSWRDYGEALHPDAPVVMVTWEDAIRFAKWLSEQSNEVNCRLPTEAEWEYAARAGTDTEFVFGDSPTKLDDFGWCGVEREGVSGPQAVGQKRPNAWGLYDTHGNVFEWVHDWYGGPFETGSAVDPQGPDEGKIRVVRGGSWATDIGSCRSNHRAADRPTLSESHVGFRMLCQAASRQ